MPRLLSLNSYHYRRGGSDVVYFEHEAMFRDLGWETAHMAMLHPRNEPSGWSEYFVDEIEFGHSYGTWQKVGMAGKVIYSFEARRKLSRLLDSFKADIAHVHCIYHHLSPSVLPLLRDRGVPVVLTAHDLKIACPAYKMLSGGQVCERCKGGNLLHVVANRCVQGSTALSALVAIESTVSRVLGLYRGNVARVVAPSLFYRQKLQEWGWPSRQIAYVPNYVDGECYQPEYAPGDYFLYFGRLAPEKGLKTLVRSAEIAGVRLKLVGTGPDEAVLRAHAHGNANVEVLGYRSGEELWSLVRGCRAVVLPSEWYENAPMSVLESYACGKPVIGSDMGGIPELIVDGETGAIFRARETEELAGVLARFAAASDRSIEELGRNARSHVVSEFNLARYRDSMLDLYAEVGSPRTSEAPL